MPLVKKRLKDFVTALLPNAVWDGIKSYILPLMSAAILTSAISYIYERFAETSISVRWSIILFLLLAVIAILGYAYHRVFSKTVSKPNIKFLGSRIKSVMFDDNQNAWTLNQGILGLLLKFGNEPEENLKIQTLSSVNAQIDFVKKNGRERNFY